MSTIFIHEALTLWVFPNGLWPFINYGLFGHLGFFKCGLFGPCVNARAKINSLEKYTKFEIFTSGLGIAIDELGPAHIWFNPCGPRLNGGGPTHLTPLDFISKLISGD